MRAVSFATALILLASTSACRDPNTAPAPEPNAAIENRPNNDWVPVGEHKAWIRCAAREEADQKLLGGLCFDPVPVFAAVPVDGGGNAVVITGVTKPSSALLLFVLAKEVGELDPVRFAAFIDIAPVLESKADPGRGEVIEQLERYEVSESVEEGNLTASSLVTADCKGSMTVSGLLFWRSALILLDIAAGASGC